ncbi:hypothetical protein DFQ28_002245 [Apophysomyces sp. BC1034]|nr:hypothetical protein DFQ30_002813 [Apophysomyces sp. BC1015]KAG0179756.1 hypothetical protein DFQ29_001699 [Apophysomyces sp. BC1021]KAG0190295.1 hypothetical protein DFQ28_002245 [Apophysomyces sp. BC1034]
MVFFTPCLLFYNIAYIISVEKLIAFWPIPVFFGLFSLLSFLAAQVAVRVVGLEKKYHRFVAACSVLCNTNSLPLAILSSLAMSDAGAILYWNADDTRETVAARGISYALFYGLFANILRWSYGYNVLQPKMSDNDQVMVVSYQNNNNMPYYGSTSRSSDATSYDSDLEQQIDEDGRRSSAVTITALDHDIPKHPGNERNNLISSFPTLPTEEHTIPTTPWGLASPANHYLGPYLPRAAQSIHQYMSPPLYAAFFALFIGLVPPLKAMMFSNKSFLYPTLTRAIESCSKPAVPVILLCLGSQLSTISTGQIPSKATVTTIVVRMCIVPFLVVPGVIWFAKHGSAWATIASDPAFLVIMVVLGCTPSALNLVQVTQVSGYCQEEMLELLFWSYGVVCVPVCTLVVFIALAAVDKFV